MTTRAQFIGIFVVSVMLNVPVFCGPMLNAQDAEKSGADKSATQENPRTITQEPVAENDAEGDRKKLAPLPEKLTKEIGDAIALNPESTVFLDVPNKRVVLRTEVACNNCLLEMLLVPEGNREHETILRIRSKAYIIHTGLLALGLEPGKAAQFSPEFVPPSGPTIAIEAVWVDEKGKLQRTAAQDWMRHNIHRYYSAPLSGPPPGLTLPYKDLRWDKFNNEILWYGPMSDADRDDLLSKWEDGDYQKAIQKFYADSQSRPMKARFVFVGSSMYTDEQTGEQFYQAEGGHVICTSNFPDALLDVQEESSASDGSQAYEGWTERIPPLGTQVLLVLTEAKGSKKTDGAAAETPGASASKSSKE